MFEIVLNIPLNMTGYQDKTSRRYAIEWYIETRGNKSQQERCQLELQDFNGKNMFIFIWMMMIPGTELEAKFYVIQKKKVLSLVIWKKTVANAPIPVMPNTNIIYLKFTYIPSDTFFIYRTEKHSSVWKFVANLTIIYFLLVLVLQTNFYKRIFRNLRTVLEMVFKLKTNVSILVTHFPGLQPLVLELITNLMGSREEAQQIVLKNVIKSYVILYIYK